MKRFQLIWYNYVAQEECVDYILAKDENDAREIAYMWIRSYTKAMSLYLLESWFSRTVVFNWKALRI